MSRLPYVKPEPISLRDDPEYNEAWLRDRIREDPSILGLGDIEVKDVERRQSGAGRLDLLLQDADLEKRYEVEIQLGATDESHIIRCLEYWDIERKRYPQYDHCAVLVAEDITSRFLNVVNLFNGFIPIMALQVSALRVGDSITLHFAKVLDELTLGLEEEDEPAGPPADRAYWVTKASEDSVALAERCLPLIQELTPGVDIKYNRHYIGLVRNGRANNFVVFRPKRKWVRVEARVRDAEPYAQRLDAAGVEVLAGGRSSGWLRFDLRKDDFGQAQDLLRDLFAAAYRQQES